MTFFDSTLIYPIFDVESIGDVPRVPRTHLDVVFAQTSHVYPATPVARPYQNSLTDVTRDKDNTHPETLTNKAKSKSHEAGTMRKFITRRQSNHPGWSAAVKEIARGPAAGRSGETTRACGAPTERIGRRGAPATASDKAGHSGLEWANLF